MSDNFGETSNGKDVNANANTIASKVKFEDFCKVCDKIAVKKSNTDKKKVIQDFIKWWKSQNSAKNNFYPAMRLLCPAKDIKRQSSDSDVRDEGRVSYGIKVDKLRQKYFNILALNKNSDDGKRLLNYNKGNASEYTDFATVLYHIMISRSRLTVGTITIEELHQKLDEISHAYEQSRSKDADEVFEYLIRNTTALENKWLVRVILKEMKLGIGDNSILNAFHPEAKEYFEITHSLLKICTDLTDPSVPLSVKCIQLFSPFSPMLSDRIKLNSVELSTNNKQFNIEVKYDGERFQLHKQANNYRYFSRNCNNFTDSFSESLSPFISDCFGDTQSCILDGEMLAYDTINNRVVTKTEKEFDVKRIKGVIDDKGRHPLYIAFDIVYLNGEILTAKPLSERLKILENVIKPIKTRIEFAQRIGAFTKQDAFNALNVAIDRKEEGIIIKTADSTYRTNVRRGGGWFKIKPDYVDGLMDELDLLVIGGFYGDRGGISHFMLALKVENDSQTKFISVARVGTGYTNEELINLYNKLEKHWNKYDKKTAPNNLEFGRLKPHVWIEPTNSIVFQVKAAEIMESNGDYKTEHTLRFPRVVLIRDDKNCQQCMTFHEFEDMRTQGMISLDRLGDDSLEPEKKRRKLMDRPTLSKLHKMADTSNLAVMSQIFKDKELCVLPFTDTKHSKISLEEIIVENGGTVTASPLHGKTYCIIAFTNNSIAAKKYLNSGKYNVVKVDWLLRCVNSQQLLDWTPHDMWSQSHQTKHVIQKQFDKFGDSYTENIYESELKLLFENIDLKSINLLTNLEMADIEFRYWANDMDSYCLFRTIKVYVDIDSNISIDNKFRLRIAINQLRFYGATVVDTVDDMPTHVLLDSSNPNILNHYRNINRRNARKFHIVNCDWIQKCIENEKISEPIIL